MFLIIGANSALVHSIVGSTPADKFIERRLTTVAIRGFLRFTCILAVGLFACCGASAQQSTPPSDGKAAINGTVTDQTQAVVPGAKAVLSNASGFKQEALSDDKGAYVFRGIEAGTYTLTVTAPNFAVQNLD